MAGSKAHRKDNLEFRSLCARELQDLRSGDAHVLPIYASTSFVYETIEDSIEAFTGAQPGYVYSRYGNPTIAAVEEKISALENFDTDFEAFAVMCNSGMGAISTLAFSLLKEGDEMVTQGNLYGGTTELFRKILGRNGIKVHFADLRNQEAIDEIIRRNPRIKLLYFETPTNPTLSCIDIENMTDLCKRHDIFSAIDNTFATPYLQRPFALGVDFIVHSTTKFLNGHGNAIAGCIVGKNNDHRLQIWETMKLMGTNTNPWDAWLTHNGIKTLPVRMDAHCHNAMQLARFLENHPRVRKVNYPGLQDFTDYSIARNQMTQFGGMLSFEVDGDTDMAKKVMNNARMCTISATLGNIDTLLLHPVTSSHLNVSEDVRQEFGITEGLIRVSVGIESADDIIGDISQALDAL